MTILGGGDLSPRRHRGSLGRWLVAAVVVALLAGGGYAAYLGLTGSSSPATPAAAPHPCPSSAVQSPSGPAHVHVVVMNGTLRDGLAARVRSSLERRGFHVPRVGNAPKPVDGVAVVRYGTGHLLEAEAVADQIQGATLKQKSSAGVELDLGARFNTLRTPLEADVARAHTVAVQRRALATASPSPAPTC